MRKGPNVNITYLWDVVDSRGQRVHRISGEEALANGVDVKQPWAAVTPAVSRMIALKTMEDLGRWARSAQPHTAGGIAPPPPAGAGASSLSIAPAGGR